MSKRDKSIDFLRGVLMLIVIWSHSVAYENEPIGKYLIACFMSAFFFLSGYCQSEKVLDFPEFIKKKSKSLLLPYVLYGSILVLINYILTSDTGLFKRNIVGLLYGRYMQYPGFGSDNIYFYQASDSTLWFLLAMYVTSILFYIFRRLDKLKPIFLVCLILAAIWMSNISILIPWSLDTSPVFCFFMVCGYLYKDIEKRMEKINVSSIITLWFLIVVAYWSMVNGSGDINLSVRMYGGQEVLSVLTCVVIGITGSLIYLRLSRLLLKLDNPIFAYIAWIGKNSLEFMCLQMLFIDLIYDMPNISNSYRGIIQILVATGACSVICALKKWILSLISNKKSNGSV